MKLGCMCAVEKDEARKLAVAGLQGLNTFSLEQLQMKNLPYLKDVCCVLIYYLFIYFLSSREVILCNFLFYSEIHWRLYIFTVIVPQVALELCLVYSFHQIIKPRFTFWTACERTKCLIWVLCIQMKEMRSK